MLLELYSIKHNASYEGNFILYSASTRCCSAFTTPDQFKSSELRVLHKEFVYFQPCEGILLCTFESHTIDNLFLQFPEFFI